MGGPASLGGVRSVACVLSPKPARGPLKIMATGVNKQVGSKDALLAMIPSLGPKGGEFTGAYREAFERIVLKGEDIKAVISELGPKLLKLFEEVGAPLPPPDSG